MTREQIEALEPGRELDAIVAEKVMGFVDVGESFYRTPTEDIYHISDIEFSTDPNAHAALWDKLIADGWSIRVGTGVLPHWQPGEVIGVNWAEVFQGEPLELSFPSRGQTRYHALAKCALLAYSEQ